MDGVTPHALCLSELRNQDGSTILSIAKNSDVGWYNYVGYRIPSFRRDVVKLAVCGISESYCGIEYVVEVNRELVSQDGKTKYNITPIESETRQERAMEILSRYSEELESEE